MNLSTCAVTQESYLILMTHDEWLEEYIDICATIFIRLQREGRLEEVLSTYEKTRTEKVLETNDIS